MKKIIALLLAVSLALPIAFSVFANNTEITFSDVDKNTELGKAIYKLVNAGVIVGIGDGTFAPDRALTRAELARIVNLIFGYTEKSDQMFNDINPNAWYYNDAMIARKAGFIVGYSDGGFHGKDYVTREQVCTIICSLAGLYDLGIEMPVSDKVSGWAKPYVQKVLQNGLMTLEENNTFRATVAITRAEFCKTFAVFQEEVTPTVSPTVSVSPSPTSDSSGGGGGGGGVGGDTPSTSSSPSVSPSTAPGTSPVASTKPSTSPVASTKPTTTPTVKPTTTPTVKPTTTPTVKPTTTPTVKPTTTPTVKPTTTPTVKPTTTPTVKPTTTPTVKPTTTPTVKPTTTPTVKPTTTPTVKPTTTPTVKPTATPNYAAENKEMVEHLKAVSADITANLYGFQAGKPRKMIMIIKKAIDDTISQANRVIITADFVRTEYKAEIAEAKGYYNDIKANETMEARFNESLAALNTETITWLATEFGLI